MSGNNFESTEKKLCPSCGAEVTGNFCSNCGAKLEEECSVLEKEQSAYNSKVYNEKFGATEHSENEKNTSNICPNCKEEMGENVCICTHCGNECISPKKSPKTSKGVSKYEIEIRNFRKTKRYNELKECGKLSDCKKCNRLTVHNKYVCPNCGTRMRTNIEDFVLLQKEEREFKEKPSTEKVKRKYGAVKYIVFVLVVSVAMFAIFNAAKCKHKNYLLYTNYNKATCQQQAVNKYVCEYCGEAWTEDTGEYGKHKYNPTGEKTERGDEYICEVCGEYWYYKTSKTQGADKKTATSNSTTTNKTARPLTDEEVCVCAIDIVEKNMYNPSSAKFCLFSEMDITRFDDNSYLVMGWVEGTNGYGATVRQTFLVNFTVTLNENGKEIYKDAECTFL